MTKYISAPINTPTYALALLARMERSFDILAWLDAGNTGPMPGDEPLFITCEDGTHLGYDRSMAVDQILDLMRQAALHLKGEYVPYVGN